MKNYCSIEGCDRPVHGRGLCNGHYRRVRRTGTPGESPIGLPGFQLGHKINVGNSFNPFRPGHPNVGGLPHHYAGDDIGYGGMHDRLRIDRGRPISYACEDCGGPAAQWSYDHADPAEKTQVREGRLVTYSVRAEHYQPRCVPCHTRFDSRH